MMKKIFLLLILSSFAYAAIAEYKTDVYFSNGISTEDEDAKRNAKLLDAAIEDKLGTNQYNKQIGKVDYSYNNTNGIPFDLTESADQKLNIIKWRDWLASLFGYVTSHASDLKKQIDAYKASISSGHSVLVVAHSQGNLFTGEAFAALSPCMQERFEAVSIASPMSANIKYGTPRINWEVCFARSSKNYD